MSGQTIDPHRRRQRAGAQPLTGVTFALALAMLTASPAWASKDRLPASRADCDAPQATGADPAPSVPARALWLDGRRLRWPGADPAGRYVLVATWHSAAPVRPGELPADRVHQVLSLQPDRDPLAPDLERRFAWAGPGPVLALDASTPSLAPLLRGQLAVARLDAEGRVLETTGVQLAGAIDDLYAAAVDAPPLGAIVDGEATAFRLWAPTASAVAVCLHDDDRAKARAVVALARDDANGIWSASREDAPAGTYYTYLVDVVVPGVGQVRNRVTDPYAASLGADSKRSVVIDFADPELAPPGWAQDRAPRTIEANTDLVVYELHVRDFSVSDPTVPAAHRGKYLAFAEPDSTGVRHLKKLAAAGVTDVHLLPVFDLATVPETGCVQPDIPPRGPGDREDAQAIVAANAQRDCFNWGYDPLHFNAPEGSYATDASDGTARIREFRAMVMALHRAGLRVGMDVVYNHMSASGQDPRSVLDRIVPGYYHRLDADGAVTKSTCCANTATEHAMMARLMLDSAEHWVRHFHVDSFRFDLMGHQPRAAMQALQARVDAAAGRRVPLLGEGWNFGEVADGARFVQASQLSLADSGIATFSDRARDAVRGGGPADSGEAMLAANSYVGNYPKPGSAEVEAEVRRAADLVRVGLAGSLRDYEFVASDGAGKPLSAVDYKGAPGGYVAQPGEVVNYVENHDNQTLFDLLALKLPPDTPSHERARVQLLAAATTAFSQGVAYFHAGLEVLRSKSLDRNSYDSGDWFNRLDYTGADNGWARGLPPKNDNGRDWPLLAPRLADARIRATPDDVAFMRDAFLDLLRIRASSSLFRLRTADDVAARLTFPNSGREQDPRVLAGHLDGAGLADAGFAEVAYFINVADAPRTLVLPAQARKAFVLHPVHRAADAADARAAQATYAAATGAFTVPARTAVAFVVE
jgi:pullulanase